MKKKPMVKISSRKSVGKKPIRTKRYKVIHCKTTREFEKNANDLFSGKLKGRVCVQLD